MSVRLANEIRPVDAPPYCSACFNQDTSKRHLDFDAACDRGYGNDPDVRINMDDLILCEDCVRTAAVQIGMMDTETFQQELETAHRLHRQEKDRADSIERYAEQLEGAFNSRPEPIAAPRRRGRPPKDDD